MFILGITPGEGFDAARWEAVLRSGLDALMIREKQMGSRELLAAVRWAQERSSDVELWVNGRLDVALAAGCGLHAPERHPEVPPDLVPLSRPIHAEDQFPARQGSQQLLVAPIFAVPGKNEPWGGERLHRALNGLPVLPLLPQLPTGPRIGPRILALGGIGEGNAGALRHPRLDGIALTRALWDSPEPSRVVEALRRAWL